MLLHAELAAQNLTSGDVACMLIGYPTLKSDMSLEHATLACVTHTFFWPSRHQLSSKNVWVTQANVACSSDMSDFSVG